MLPVKAPVILSAAEALTATMPSAPKATRETLNVLLPPVTTRPPEVRVRVVFPAEVPTVRPLPVMLRALKVRLASSEELVMKPAPTLRVSVEIGASAELMLV